MEPMSSQVEYLRYQMGINAIRESSFLQCSNIIILVIRFQQMNGGHKHSDHSTFT